jgi:hypothetical protein
MKRLLTSLLLTICFCSIAFAQDDASDKTKKALAEAAKNGNGLRTDITVNGNVHAQAVLIPRVDANRIFGKEIANNYAVIEVNVGNKSKDAALIIHGIFIDYREWPFSGATSAQLNAGRSTDSFQVSAFPNQVASEEYRIVRGQLLDAQTDTVRNRFLRWLTLAGNLAGAFTFSINEQGIVKGIAAATGVGIPGVATAWPDRTIEQLNRVSDFGFRSNKVIPREGSDIMVCFFPIDRFLTKGFRKLFLKSPALFFAPGQMLVDKTVQKDVDEAIGSLLEGFDFDAKDLRKELPCFMRVTHPVQNDPGYDVCIDRFGLQIVKDSNPAEHRLEVKHVGTNKPLDGDIKKFDKFMALQFINSVSLNRVTVTVDGVMAVDVKTIAARIDEIDLDKVDDCGDANGQCFWNDINAAGGVRKGVFRGAYFKTGTIGLAEQDDLDITDLKVIDDGSNDEALHFSFKLTRPIPSQTKLHFTVSKDVPESDTARAHKSESNTWEYLVAYPTTATTIASANLSADKKTLTVKGKLFTSPTAANSPMTVTLHSEAGTKTDVAAASITFTNATQFAINSVDTLNLKPGCWYVQVEVNDLSSNRSNKFSPTAPVPTLDSATRHDKFIQVKGNDLINFSHCEDNKVSFRLTQTGAAQIPLTVKDWNKGEPILVLPDAAKTGDWILEVLVDGNPITPTAITTALVAPTPPTP